jgi:hypothetical protein
MEFWKMTEVVCKDRLKAGVHSIAPKSEGMDFGIGRNALE